MALIELFCGIGGAAEAARQLARADLVSARAIDIDRDCGVVYQHNFGLAVDHQTIESIDWGSLVEIGDDAWWMSPPCQPYCRRGRGDHENDRRCDALLSLIAWLDNQPTTLPRAMVLENVPQFASSSHRDRLCCSLERNGFRTSEVVLCPTQFGIPNRRRRYYLIASRTHEATVAAPHDTSLRFSVADVLDSPPPTQSPLWLAIEVASKYAGALDIVDADDPLAMTACFASGYGKSIIRSGSYLRHDGRLRRFSPDEVARLLGYSAEFSFPLEIADRKRWKMLGNGLSIPVAKAVLDAV
ncbi:DNA cytosine methyltransferase [Rubripirellula tenax]|nr:DNA cytosine methyltransferase [Rubripirellula tenax]